MRIEELSNYDIKIGPRSITVKNPETGKTAGVIRDIVSLYDLQPNKQIDFYGQLKKASLKGICSIRDIYIHDDKMFFVLRKSQLELFDIITAAGFIAVVPRSIKR